jgi:iron uptake system component EfeO
MRLSSLSIGLSAALLLSTCGDEEKIIEPPCDGECQALNGVKTYITTNLDELLAASKELQAAAPAPDADGWSATNDAASVEKMKAAWKKARRAYEHIEGAIAVLFPDIDVSTDERYDGFVETMADDNLFDDEGVTGIHAIERILWSDSIPARVVTFESNLPNYKAAAFPATQQEADDFRNKLCARLIADVQTMVTQFKPLALDTAAAYRGVIGSIQEQVEKVRKASSAEDESRYAQFTLADMRANLEGGIATVQAFRPWIEAKEGTALLTAIDAGVARIKKAYDDLPGDSIPAVPAGWQTDAPTEEQLATPYGKLYTLLLNEGHGEKDGTTVKAMLDAADLLGIPQLP